MSVTATLETLNIPTYGLGQPEKNPVFFEKRVYQGSCGKVYPIPLIDKVDQDHAPTPVPYQAARLENEYLRLVMLPEIGGRIFLGQDKANQDYDFFYRQDVIKPALVGLAGPWISGGVEFNWPQHHRPGTYLPTDVAIEAEADGVYTVWMSEHDPLNRLKGMHGIRIRPGSSLIELRARLYNRTAHHHTFLWWANVAARVHEHYQSFFPSDVHYVADHAVRAMSSFPVADGDYYGIDYGKRAGQNDLTRYANIPVPTSYMVCQTQFDFFGGYDHDAGGGFVHVANRHISPGKKQWTWGNDEFGWAWDRELTDTNGPYIELMAGVYTDNQPDFSYLAPYETKTFSQFWWPYQKLGPVQQANKDLAIRMVVDEHGAIDLGVVASRRMDDLRLLLREGDQIILETPISVAPDQAWQAQSGLQLTGDSDVALHCQLVQNGDTLLEYRPVRRDTLIRERELATEPAMPEAMASSDELYFTGEHLELNRHPTRYPELYWEEALRRDPDDVRCHIALGKQKLLRGRFDAASAHLEAAVRRLTARHPNPETGEAHYYLGLTRRYQGHFGKAYERFYKATWDYSFRASAHYELACLELRRGTVSGAIMHLDSALETNATSNKTQVLRAICLRRSEDRVAAKAQLQQLLALDPLDHWALAELHRLDHGTCKLSALSRNDAQTALDIAYDYADAGCIEEAIEVLEHHHAEAVIPVQVPNPMERSPLTHYTLAWLQAGLGNEVAASATLEHARSQSADYCFPSRLHEMVVLQWALDQEGADRNAAYGLGNFYYDKKRHDDAIAAWEQARQADDAFAPVHRNLGIAFWNVRRDAVKARKGYEQALKRNPADSRYVVEYVQLCERLGDSAASRLAFLEDKRELVLERDDATVELASLYNQTEQPKRALDLLNSRSFHPWEGGEGKVLRQYTTAHLQIGRAALEAGDAMSALEHFDQAMETPDKLGEKYHPLQAKADVSYWQGKALQALGEHEQANARFEAAAAESGDFLGMAVTAFSELTSYKALALRELGRHGEAEAIVEAMATWAKAELKKPANIDYFATSLPNLLVFEQDLEASKKERMQHLLEWCAAYPNAV